MEINLKDTLRALRQKKNITQEALANHLGITQQSVGKWERGEGFPDITLLPRIALYFDVTVDELLDVGKARIEEKIQAYQDESARYKKAGETEKNLSLWERAYEEFPNDCRVMNGLMFAINQAAGWPIPKEAAERMIFLGELILQASTDTAQRELAIQCQCRAYDSIGDEKNALRYADMGGSLSTTREHLRAQILKGDNGIITCQTYLATLIVFAAETAMDMVKKGGFSPEEKITVCRFGIDLFDLLYPDGNMGLYAGVPCQLSFLIAQNYAELGDAKGTLEALEENKKYAIIASTDQEKPYSMPMVNRLGIAIVASKPFKGNHSNRSLQGLEWSGFDFIREDERFRQIANQLKQYAE